MREKVRKRLIRPKCDHLTLLFLQIFEVLKKYEVSFSNLIFLESLEAKWSVQLSKRFSLGTLPSLNYIHLTRFFEHSLAISSVLM